MTARIKRQRQLNVMLSDPERNALRAIAADQGLSMGAVVRMWIHRETRKRNGHGVTPEKSASGAVV